MLNRWLTVQKVQEGTKYRVLKCFDIKEAQNILAEAGFRVELVFGDIRKLRVGAHGRPVAIKVWPSRHRYGFIQATVGTIIIQQLHSNGVSVTGDLDTVSLDDFSRNYIMVLSARSSIQNTWKPWEVLSF